MYKRIVIKLGTSVLTGGSRHLNHPRMVELVRQCAELHHQGREIIMVSSGAQAAGRARLNFPDLPRTIANRQLFAAVGQSRLMLTWERFFEIYSIHVGQILLTRADVEDRARYLNALDAFSALIEQRIVPIVNENDAVATEEIKVGDNDNLSALVATLTHADVLLLLTDQAGLYTADPRANPAAQLVREVPVIDDKIWELAGGSKSGLGTGGMVTKLQAANIAQRAGIHVIIADGREPNIIQSLAAGERIGTFFPASATRLESRKRWILAGPKPAGKLIIDTGAVRALTKQGRSLLPAGIVGVQGEFSRSDTVSIVDGEQRELARGIVAYDHQALRQILGCQSDKIEQRLGYDYGPVAVHRNNMILWGE
jgi:glutamate 5-kinase